MDEKEELPQEFQEESSLFLPEELKESTISSFNAFDLFGMHATQMCQNSQSKLHARKQKQETAKMSENENENGLIFYQLVFDIKHCIFKAGNDTLLFRNLQSSSILNDLYIICRMS